MHRCMCAVIQKREGLDKEEKLEELLAKLSRGSLRFWQSHAIFILVRMCTRCTTCKLNWQQNTASGQWKQLRSEVSLKYLKVLPGNRFWTSVPLWLLEKLYYFLQMSKKQNKTKAVGGWNSCLTCLTLPVAVKKINKSKIILLFLQILYYYSHVTNNYSKHCPQPQPRIMWYTVWSEPGRRPLWQKHRCL